MPTTTRITITTVPGLDAAAQTLAWCASKFTRVRGAGVFWIGDSEAFMEAWSEPGAWTLRVGRVELQVDMQAA